MGTAKMMIRDQLNLLQKNADDVNRVIQNRIEKTDLKTQWKNFYETLTAFTNLDNETIEKEKLAVQEEIVNFVKKLNTWKESTKTFIEQLEDSPDMQKAALGGGAIGIAAGVGIIGLILFMTRKN
jgi:hypothetical protein